jgi:type II secretion system (T2SS) protein G
MERDSESSPWHITSVRLGDQNWVSVPELIAALNESKSKATTASLAKLTAGVASYRQQNGSLPSASDIKALTDVLHPLYMRELVLEDAWGRQILVETSTSNLRFRSVGPDGVRDTPDDLLSAE